MTQTEEKKEGEDYLPSRVRMISLGDTGVGKSALIKRHCEHRFVSRYVMTIGIDYGVIKEQWNLFIGLPII